MIHYILLLTIIVVVILTRFLAALSLKSYKQNSTFLMLSVTMGLVLIAKDSAGASLPGFSAINFWLVQTLESTFITFGLVYIVHPMLAERG